MQVRQSRSSSASLSLITLASPTRLPRRPKELWEDDHIGYPLLSPRRLQIDLVRRIERSYSAHHNTIPTLHRIEGLRDNEATMSKVLREKIGRAKVVQEELSALPRCQRVKIRREEGVSQQKRKSKSEYQPEADPTESYAVRLGPTVPGLYAR
jgi:hypothetical protein